MKVIAVELSKADAYRDDWYGYARNQLAHFALGVTTASILSQMYFIVMGEFAHKVGLWLIIAAGYAAFELIYQGWRGRDTLEDWLFFAFYGAGLPIFLFHEVEVGSPALVINSQMVIPVFGVVFCHLAGGILSRIQRTK